MNNNSTRIVLIMMLLHGTRICHACVFINAARTQRDTTNIHPSGRPHAHSNYCATSNLAINNSRDVRSRALVRVIASSINFPHLGAGWCCCAACLRCWRGAVQWIARRQRSGMAGEGGETRTRVDSTLEIKLHTQAKARKALQRNEH